MIKFFKKIRKKLLAENKFSKYLIYAFGEVILVVIGILIALQINNWNDVNRNTKKEIVFLNELRKNIEADLDYLQETDSTLAVYESNSERALEMFYEAKDYQDLLFVDSLFNFQWGDWEISQSVFDEMQYTGSLYGLKNDSLKERIASYYKLIETRVYANKKINDQSIKLSESTVLYQLGLLRNSNEIFNGQLEGSWIGNPNSSEFMSLYKFYSFTTVNCNTYRRRFGQHIMTEGSELLKELNKELHVVER